MGAILGAVLAMPFVGSHAVAAGAAELGMLRQLEPGLWSVRYREGAGASKICVRTGTELLALNPPAANCRRSIVEDGTSQVVVQDSCRGNGYARTSVRRESAKLVQISAQGFGRGVPFTISAEARRTGSC